MSGLNQIFFTVGYGFVDTAKLGPYLTGNTLLLRYKAQPVNAV
jgi:hypothetical protein